MTTPQKFIIDTQNYHLKRSHLAQIIILGIHVGVRGCRIILSNRLSLILGILLIIKLPIDHPSLHFLGFIYIYKWGNGVTTNNIAPFKHIPVDPSLFFSKILNFQAASRQISNSLASVNTVVSMASSSRTLSPSVRPYPWPEEIWWLGCWVIIILHTYIYIYLVIFVPS